MKRFLPIAFVVLLCACPGAEQNDGPVDVCVSAGAKCKMSGGQLGVCTFNEQQLVCASQH